MLGIQDLRWLDLLEAPHRGYHSAPALFGGVHEGDAVAAELAPLFGALAAEFEPDLVLAPQGLGNHVDHQHVVAAALQRRLLRTALAFYRDTPYAIRQPGAAAAADRAAGSPSTIAIGAVLDRKVAAAQAYTTPDRLPVRRSCPARPRAAPLSPAKRVGASRPSGSAAVR